MNKPGKPLPDGEEEGSFLSRWSRRKAEAREGSAEPKPVAEPAAEEEAVFDPASLPPIESLTAQSDFSGFLKKGVPTALRAAALRKLWLIEPSVVNYQPLVEYNWDFTAPGYGDLLPTDDVAKLARQIFAGYSQQPKTEPVADTAAEPLHPEGSAPEQLPVPDEAPLASLPPDQKPQEQDSPLPQRRRHGGALPS